MDQDTSHCYRSVDLRSPTTVGSMGQSDHETDQTSTCAANGPEAAIKRWEDNHFITVSRTKNAGRMPLLPRNKNALNFDSYAVFLKAEVTVDLIVNLILGEDQRECQDI